MANLSYAINNSLSKHFQDYINPFIREALGKLLNKVRLIDNINFILLHNLIHNLNDLPLALYLKRITDAKVQMYRDGGGVRAGRGG